MRRGDRTGEAARIARRSLLLAAAALPGTALAQEQPGKAIQLIIPFAPGASADGVARVVATALGHRLKQTVVADNRAGGGGSLGLSILARAAPDGYTLGIGATGAMVINPHTPEATALNPLRQLAPVAKVADIPIVLVASRRSNLTSLSQVVAASKSGGDGLSYGTTGTNSAQHLAVELLRSSTGAKLEHVPYRGSAPAVTDVLAGTLPLASVDLTSALPHIQAGALAAIAVTSPARSPLAPEIPTVAESGIAGYAATAWLGMFAPSGTPEPVLQRLSAEIGGVIADPAARDRISALAAEPAFLPAAEFARFLQAESAKWERVIGSLAPGR
jgi:tripartite-type tricarboxylate transporter receptor subunit TctC